MSLICARCGKIVVMSNNPDHLGCCGGCSGQLTEDQKKNIEHSSKIFVRKSAEEFKNRGKAYG